MFGYSKIRTRMAIIGLLCLMVSTSSHCQEFSVRNFRTLNNDISAFINQVTDLNDDACALIKVICPKEFAFSTPLGIVKRINEVGEIWLYVPQKSVMLTIKHPKWGVLRDFRFPSPLQSRLTYELTLHMPEIPAAVEPGIKEVIIQKDTVIVKDTVITTQYIEKAPQKKVRKPLEFNIMASVGISGSPIYGIRFATGRKMGVYLHGASNFNKKKGVPGIGNDYDTGETSVTKHIAIAGSVQKLSPKFYIFEGIGYGKFDLYQQKYSKLWWKNPEESYRGAAIEAGFVVKCSNRFMISASITSIAFNHWEPCAGFGISF